MGSLPKAAQQTIGLVEGMRASQWVQAVLLLEAFLGTVSEPRAALTGNWKQLNGDADCWSQCGSKGGLCEGFCGPKGYCCRKGHHDCPVLAANVSPSGHHTCVTQGGCRTTGKDVIFEGAKIANGSIRANIASAEACSDLCDADTQCHFWSWVSPNKVRMRFIDRKKEKPGVSGAISGECKIEVNPEEGRCYPTHGVGDFGTPTGALPYPRIMLIGESGAGKSTLSNQLMGNICGDYASVNYNNTKNSTSHLCATFGVGHGVESETQNTTWIAGKWLGNQNADQRCFAVVDTPGIGDSSGKARDCRNFIGVAKMAREISPIDAFLLVIKGTETRIGPELVSQLRFFHDLFGDSFWSYTTFAISFWSHTAIEARKRQRRRNGLDETKMTFQLNQKLQEFFPGITPIPAVFVDPVYEAEFSEDEREIQRFAEETEKLWTIMTNGKRFECGESCSSSTFLTGTPKLALRADPQTKKRVVSARVHGRLSVSWEIWFGDCDQEGVRSYQVLKDNLPIYDMEEAPYIATEPWEPGRGRALPGKPLGLDIVDKCSNTEQNGDCDNLKSKYKIVTLSFAFSFDHIGKYKIHNMRGDSEELEVLEMVDGTAEEWGEWSPCTITCMGGGGNLTMGTRLRERKPVPPKNGGNNFKGDLVDRGICGSASGEPQWCIAKPDHWTPWSRCSQSCGVGGTRERTRTCSGHGCPPQSKLREIKVCAERDNFNDWIQKCPVPSRYSEWGTWSCNSRCFNPRRRGGTYQTRTRRCIDDTPNKHKTQNCLTMHSLEEKVTPCLSDPAPYVTYKGTSCSIDCGTYGERYYWCYTSLDEWDYCSDTRSYTRYGEACKTSCAKGEETYYWCRKYDGGWDYCSS